MANVIERKRFIAVDPIANNNKYWEYTRTDDGMIAYEWGRVGCEKPGRKTEPFNPKKLASQIKEKTNKSDGPSYNEIAIIGDKNAPTATPVNMAKEEVKRRAVTEIAGACPITAALVKKLAETNKHELVKATGGIAAGGMDIDLETGIVRTALGVVTLDAVKEARKILDRMIPYVKAGQTDNETYARNLLGDYLRLVPQKVPAKQGWHRDFIDLAAQSSLLDQLESSIELANQRMVDAAASASKSAVPAPPVFECKLTLVSDRKVIEEIKSAFYANRSSMHQSSSLRPVKVYEVHIPHMDKAFEADGKKVGNIKRLWHGTRMFNILSILKRGFVLPNQLSTMQMTGAMFGNGVYFSNNSTKSLNYSYGYWDGGSRDKNCYMFMVDVAMGREYIPSGSGNGQRAGYDSCHAVPGRSGIMNDEQIVYRTSQANIKYLVEFDA